MLPIPTKGFLPTFDRWQASSGVSRRPTTSSRWRSGTWSIREGKGSWTDWNSAPPCLRWALKPCRRVVVCSCIFSVKKFSFSNKELEKADIWCLSWLLYNQLNIYNVTTTSVIIIIIITTIEGFRKSLKTFIRVLEVLLLRFTPP